MTDKERALLLATAEGVRLLLDARPAMGMQAWTDNLIVSTRLEQSMVEVLCEDRGRSPNEVSDDLALSLLTPSQCELIKWLAGEEWSQYGECHGKDLDLLVEHGLAILRDSAGSFVAKGDGRGMYAGVRLTERGQTYAAKLRDRKTA